MKMPRESGASNSRNGTQTAIRRFSLIQFARVRIGPVITGIGVACLANQLLTTAVSAQSIPSGASRQLAWPEEALRDGKIAAPVPPRAKLLFEETFENPESGFPRGVVGICERDYENGRYFIRTTGGPSLFVWHCPQQPVPNCALQITGRVVGLGSDSWGIRITNYPFHWVTVSLNNDGELFVDPDDDVEPGRGPKIGPVKHSAIKTNEKFNTLLLVIRGRVMEIYVNDVAVCDPVVSDRDLSPSVFALRARRKDAATNDKPDIRAEFEKMTAWSSDGMKKPESRGAVPKTVPSPNNDPVPGETVNGPPLFAGDLGDAKLIQERLTMSDGPKVSFGVEDRLYQILGKVPGRYRADVAKLNKISNFACLAYARLEKASDGGWGVTFGDTTSGRFEAQIREAEGKRQIRLVYVVKETDDEVIPWIDCPALRTLTQFNALRVEANGKSIRLFANGVFIVEKEEPRLVPGAIHPLVFVETQPVDARFSFFHVWRLKGGK